MFDVRQRNATQYMESLFMKKRRPAGYLVTEQRRAGKATDVFTSIPSIVRQSHGSRDYATRRTRRTREGEKRTGVNKRDRAAHSLRPASCSKCVSVDENNYLTHGEREKEKSLFDIVQQITLAREEFDRAIHVSLQHCVMLSFCA